MRFGSHSTGGRATVLAGFGFTVVPLPPHPHVPPAAFFPQPQLAGFAQGLHSEAPRASASAYRRVTYHSSSTSDESPVGPHGAANGSHDQFFHRAVRQSRINSHTFNGWSQEM